MALIKRLSFLIIFLSLSCSKVDVSNRGDSVFRSIDDILVDASMDRVPVVVGYADSVSSWPFSDYYSELGDFNHSFDGNFIITSKIPLRNTSIFDKARNGSSFVNRMSKLFLNQNNKILLDRPIFFDNKIAVSDIYGVISLFDVNNKFKTIWEINLNKILHKKIKGVTEVYLCYGDGKVFIVTNNGYIVCVNSSTGKIEWRKDIGHPIRSTFKYRNGKIYGLSALSKVLVYNSETGDKVIEKEHSTPLRITRDGASVVFIDNYMITGFSNGDLVGYIAETLDLAWLYDVAVDNEGNFSFADIDSTPAVIDKGIMAASITGGAYFVRYFDGAVLWSNNLSINSDVAVTGSFAFFIDNQKRLIALHWPTGKVKWSRQLRDNEAVGIAKYLNGGNKYLSKAVNSKGPIIIEGKVFIFNSDGEMLGFNANSGEVEIDLTIPYYSGSPIVVDKTIYLISYEENKLIAIK